MPDKRISEVINLAQQEIGYIEKKSASGLDSKSANIGSENYTKYARDLDAIPGFLNGKKQGYAWCAVWFNWLFVKAFGVDDARRMLFLPVQSGSASCTTAVGYYRAVVNTDAKDANLPANIHAKIVNLVVKLRRKDQAMHLGQLPLPQMLRLN